MLKKRMTSLMLVTSMVLSPSVGGVTAVAQAVDVATQGEVQPQNTSETQTEAQPDVQGPEVKEETQQTQTETFDDANIAIGV